MEHLGVSAVPDGGSSGELDVIQDPGITSKHLEVGGQPSHLLGEVGTRPEVGSSVADMPMMQVSLVPSQWLSCLRLYSPELDSQGTCHHKTNGLH